MGICNYVIADRERQRSYAGELLIKSLRRILLSFIFKKRPNTATKRGTRYLKSNYAVVLFYNIKYTLTKKIANTELRLGG